MEQTRALNALEPFLALSTSANSARAASDLITQATSAPNTYVFAELLQTPNIQNLRQSPDRRPYLSLLEIFSWGTWQDYKANQDSLPTLSDAQATKLRLLSLLPLLTSPHPTAPSYASLQSHLDLPLPRDLEVLIETAISASLITAKLFPTTQSVVVSSVAPLRDLPPGCIPGMRATLEEWEARCGQVLEELEARVAGVRKAARERRGREKRLEEVWEREVEGEEENRGSSRAGMGGDERGGEGYGGGAAAAGAGKQGRKTGEKGGGLFAGLGRKLG